MRYLVLLSLFCVWFCFSNADIAFTWPVPGALLGSGDVTLWWKEDGDALLISEMGSHLLVLYTGNNNVMVCCLRVILLHIFGFRGKRISH
jgi:hypothetical protein